jgi:predicted ATPase
VPQSAKRRRGEAGIGKTRLVEEIRRVAEAQGFTTHRSLVLDFGMGIGEDPIRALVQSLLGLSRTSEPEERRQASEHLVTEGIVAPQQLLFLYDLLDLPQTSEGRTLYDAMDNAARSRGKRALAAALAAHASRCGPTLIIVDDLHWADPQSSNILRRLPRR